MCYGHAHKTEQASPMDGALDEQFSRMNVGPAGIIVLVSC